MGSALVAGILQEKIFTPADLLIIEKDNERAADFTRKGIQVLSAADPNLSECEIIFLAVKPQTFIEVGAEVARYLNPSCALISIMAGVQLSTIRNTCNHNGPVIRSMPNLPVQIGHGMTVFTVDGDLDASLRKIILAVFNAAGEVFEVSEERLIDAATAISGSGPAYVFYIIEYMTRVAEELGFTPDQAEILVRQTIGGGLQLWTSSEEDASQLRRRVTSPGGTTEAAIASFENDRLGDKLKKGIREACKRAGQLSALS